MDSPPPWREPAGTPNAIDSAQRRRSPRSTPAGYALLLVGVLMEVNALFLLRAALDFRGGNRFELVFAYGALMLAVSGALCIARKRGDLAVTILTTFTVASYGLALSFWSSDPDQVSWIVFAPSMVASGYLFVVLGARSAFDDARLRRGP